MATYRRTWRRIELGRDSLIGLAQERPKEEVGGDLLTFFLAMERENRGRE
jgi:hypothetical protein